MNYNVGPTGAKMDLTLTANCPNCGEPLRAEAPEEDEEGPTELVCPAGDGVWHVMVVDASTLPEVEVA